MSNNTVWNCANWGICVVSAGSVGNQNVTIQNNVVRDLVFGDGVTVSGCSGLTISGNIFINPDAGYYPIYLYDSTNVILSDNFVTNASANAALIEADASVTGIINAQNGIFLAGAYSFVNRLSNLVLSDPANGGASTQASQQVGLSGDNSWILSPVGNGYCALICAGNGLALGVNGSMASNAPVVMETYTGSKSQLWALAPVSNLYVALTNALSGMAVQVQSSVAGLGVVQAPFNGSANQQWFLDVLNLPICAWDPQAASGANPYTGSLTGTWENADWSAAPTGQSSPVAWSEGNNALFAANAGSGTPAFTVTMNTGHNVAGIYNGSASTGPCTVTLNGIGTITNNAGMVFDTISPGTTTISNVIAGSGGITVEGSGLLKLSGSNTYSGATTISSSAAFPTAGYNLTVMNYGFETPTVTTYVHQSPIDSGNHTQNFAATPGIGWTFSGAAGIDCNASKTFYPVNAPNGTQAAFVQGGGAAIFQSINFPSTGSYQLTWYSIGRGGFYGPQKLILEIDGNPIESFIPVQTAWTSYTSSGVSLTAGAHTVSFQGTASSDLSSCIDNVQIIALQEGVIPTDPGMGDVNGTLVLASIGSINNSSAISIAAGATFDVSAITSYVLSSSTTLIASGAGTTTGSTAAAINGASGGTISLGSQPISLTFTPTTFTGDTTHPALYIAQGTLSLNSNGFTVNNASGTALGAGTYRLVQQVSGSIASSGGYPVNVTGSGLVGIDTASVQVSSGNVNLVVTAPVAPIIQTTMQSGSSLIFKWSTITNQMYRIQSTTNLAPADWTNLSSVVTATNSTATISEPIGTNSQQFYRVVLLP